MPWASKQRIQSNIVILKLAVIAQQNEMLYFYIKSVENHGNFKEIPQMTSD